MSEDLPLREDVKGTENQEQQEPIFSNEELKRIAEAADKSGEEELKNPEKIDELKREAEGHLETHETAEELDLQAKKELREIMKEDDSKDRDERIRDFLRDKRAEGTTVSINYGWPENAIKKLYHSYTGERVFRPLSAYYFHNSYKSLYELGFDVARDQDELPELKGVSDVQEIKLENGKKGYLIKIDKKEWPSLAYGGYALPRRGVAFIPDGLSRDAEKAVTDHEIYHLNNHREEQLHGLSKIRFFRELETEWNTNIKKNLMGYIKLQMQSLISMPNTIKNVIKNFRK